MERKKKKKKEKRAADVPSSRTEDCCSRTTSFSCRCSMAMENGVSRGGGGEEEEEMMGEIMGFYEVATNHVGAIFKIWARDAWSSNSYAFNLEVINFPEALSVTLRIECATKQIKKTEPIYCYKALFTITDQNKGSKKREMKPILLQKGSSPSVPSRFQSKQSVNRKQLEITTSNRKVRSFLPRDPSGLGLNTYSRRRTSSASSVLASTMKDSPTCSSDEEQKESLSNRWPQRRNSQSLSARTPFPLHYSHIHGNPRVSRHRRASGSPEG
ncbi:hypothetical protein M9H77_13959 [Catharanthus roseus]|uniref:Uncharacterized protein n=1 Tax=Catharanthus roseus TaxID=4058 RepID=A0ACC0BLN1_CATRO|nr:hypothetical protein M9H77_13959 [Catharanthus roseus]